MLAACADSCDEYRAAAWYLRMQSENIEVTATNLKRMVEAAARTVDLDKAKGGD